MSESAGALAGRRVVVTRAARQSSGLVELLEAVGAEVVAVPCLDFVAPPADQRDALDRALRAFDDYAGLIVSSPNGVEALGEALGRVELDAGVFATKLVVAIGSGTAEGLRELGLRVDIVPRVARAEGLVQALAERGLLDRRWLQIRADEGRELLASAIAEAGGELELIVGYQTVRPSVPRELLDSLRPVAEGGRGYDAICLASGRTARHFLETTSEAFGEARARADLAAAKLVAIGPVTAKAIAELGLRVDAVAETQSELGLRDALIAALADC